MAQLPCYHVATAQGATYGVAATTKRDALQMVQDRLSNELDGLEPTADVPTTAQRVDTWNAAYGTVLQYT